MKNEKREFTRMEFLRKLVFERPKYTNTFMKFDAVGHLPEEDIEEDVEEENAYDDEEDEVQSEEESVVSASVSCSSSSSSSQSAQPASSLSLQLVCKNCNVLQKDIVMGCGHLICSVCFEKLKEVIQNASSESLISLSLFSNNVSTVPMNKRFLRTDMFSVS